MRLTALALERINIPRTRVKIALTLDHTEQWISRLIEKNKSNGPLTTASALKVIKEETGLRESEILTEEVERIGTEHIPNP